MWGYMTDYLREVLLLDDGTMLAKKKRRSEGGGLIFLGVSLIILGIAHQLFLGIIYDSKITFIAVSAVAVILGLVSLFFGLRIVNQIGQSVAEFWAEDNGYTVDEIMEFNRECHLDSTIAVHSDYWLDGEYIADCIEELKKENALPTGYITDHWFKVPASYVVTVIRLVDLAAIWYESRSIPGYDPGVFYIKSDGKHNYFRASEQIGTWIVNEIKTHNSMVITDARFQIGDVIYDAYKNPDEVAKLYREECAKRRGQA